ncbi:MAG: hypothetical protein JOZ68_19435, partial [Acidimicrobiia bacterium]|nr:hypothetical protein [Acidimicrobiia bacterium]
LKSAAPVSGNTPFLLSLALDTAPTATTLPSYNPAVNSTDPGETLVKGTGTQIWYMQAPAGGLTLPGPARLRLWTAMRGFSTSVSGSLTPQLYDCTLTPPVGCTEISTPTGGVTVAVAGTSTWAENDWELGVSTPYTVPANHYLGLTVSVPSTSGGDVMVAYDTTSYPSAVQAG